MSRHKLKQRVQEKLTTIQEHRDEIVQFLDGVVREANSVAQGLTSVTDKSKFQTKYRSTMQSLEEHLNTLFLIKASLRGEGGSSESSECDEDEDEPPDDEPDITESRNNSSLSPTPEPVSQGPGAKESAEPSAKYSKGSSGRKHESQLDSDEPEAESNDLADKVAELKIEDEQYVKEEPKKQFGSHDESIEKRPVEPLPLGAMALEGDPQIPEEQHTRRETMLPGPELNQASGMSYPPCLTAPALQPDSMVSNLPETGQQFEPVVSEPCQYPVTSSSRVNSSPESIAKPLEQIPAGPPDYHSISNEEPLVMPPPFGNRRFRREKRVITGKEASINMIMNSLNIRRETIEEVNQVQEALSAGKGEHIAATDVSQTSASSGLGPRTQKISPSCLSLKSVGNVSATSSFNPDYGFGPDIPSLIFQDGDEVNVVLLEVASPSMFWVRPAGAEPETLLEAMSVYYSKILNMNGLGCAPKVGMVCAARFTQDDMWYRAKIVGVAPDQNVSIHECQSETDQSFGPHISQVDRFVVEVMYIDYGNQEKLSENRLCQLAPEFSQMPVQAFCCALARVLPLDEQKWILASHILYAYNNTTLTGILSTEPNCPVLLLDLKLKIPGADTTFSNYLIANNYARLVSNSEIAKTFLDVDNHSGDHGPADFLEAVKSMSPKMNNSETSLVQSVGHGNSVPAFDIGESAATGQSQMMPDDQKGATKGQSSDSNNGRSNTPSTDEWKKTKADGSLDNLLDEALATREESHEMKLSGEEPTSPIDERLEELIKSVTSPKSEGALDEEAPDGWLTLSLGAPSEQLKKRKLQIPRNGYIQFMMSHINDPGDFYVHLVDERTSEVLDQLNKDLNHEYKGYMKSMMGRYFEDQYTPTLYSLCCACFTKDNTYYRASVLEIRQVIKGVRRAGQNKQRLRQPKEQEEKYEVRVFYLDFGNIEWVPGSKVYPLTHRFWNIPVQAVHCTLANVRPTGITGHWSESATSVFEQKTGFEKSFVGYVIEDGEVVAEPIPVAILDLTDETWINTLLVQKNFAVVAQIEDNGTGDEYEDADEITNWDPMKEDYLSERNSMMVDVDDACVALSGYKSESSRQPCKFYGKTKSGCWKGDECPYAHVDPSDKGFHAGEMCEAYCLIDTDTTIQVPNEDSWMPVTVSAFYNPGRFYVTFPHGTQTLLNGEKDDEGYEGSTHLPSSHRETLEMMTDALNEHYCQITRRDRQLMGLAPGEIVAAQYSENTSWYRAKVLDDDTDSRTVQVFYVDFGNSEWISEDRVRLMEPQFLHMPFQAIECFLSNVEPIDGLAWSKESRYYFQKLVNGKPLFAHIISKDLNGVLRLDLYDTENNEDIYINKLLVQLGYARNVDPTDAGSPGSTDSGRPRSRTSFNGRKKRYSDSDVIEVYMPG